MFYEFEHSFSDELFNFIKGENFSFPPHLHNSFECIRCAEGNIEVRVDDAVYSLSAGEAVLIFPNQVHEIRTPDKSRHYLCIFSPTLVKSYIALTKGEIPTDNAFTITERTRILLEAVGDSIDGRTLLDVKATLYSICAEFDKNRVYSNERKTKNELLGKIFAFLDNSYKSECNLESLAQSLGYNYVYLSRFFKESVGLSFTEYVNRCRISEAQYLLKNTSSNILAIAIDCGFKSLRSFNRNFKKIVGVSPVEYRECEE